MLKDVLSDPGVDLELREKLKSLDSLSVTDRGLSDYLEYFKLNLDFFKQMPPGSTIVNVGSGAYKVFEQQALALNPHISFISIDPSIITPIEPNGPFKVITDSGYISYINMEKNDPRNTYLRYALTPEDAQKFQAARLKLLQQIPGSLADLAPELSMVPSNSADVLFDVLGPSKYLSGEEAFTTYAKTILRVLKVGGCAFISNMNYSLRSVFVNASCEIEDLPSRSDEGRRVKVTRRY